MLRIGLVDTGFVGRLHLDGFAAQSRCKVVGVTRTWYGDVNDKPRQHAELHDFAMTHGLKAYESFDAMAGSDEIDALVITSINSYHYDQVNTALDYGKHVLIEKPVVRTCEQLQAVRNKADAANLKLIPAHNFAYRGAVLDAKRIVDAEALGAIHYASFTQSFYAGAIEGKWRSHHDMAWGGALIDSGTHLVYQAIALLGKPLKVQAMMARNVLSMDDEDIASVQLLYPNGTIAHLMQNWTSEHGQEIEGIKMVGTKGRLCISDALYVDGVMKNADASYVDSFKNQAQAFVACVLDGAAPQQDLDDALLTMQIIHAAYESAKNDRTVTLA